jgi:uncharacterized protein YjbJ (UPF0337 family)
MNKQPIWRLQALAVNEIKSEVKERWGKLTDNDLAVV